MFRVRSRSTRRSPRANGTKPLRFLSVRIGRGAILTLGVQRQVKALWSPQTLYLRFECQFRELFLFDDAEANGRRDRLWERDVAEAFLQPDPVAETLLP